VQAKAVEETEASARKTLATPQVGQHQLRQPNELRGIGLMKYPDFCSFQRGDDRAILDENASISGLA
jgi:hypothetical protein